MRDLGEILELIRGLRKADGGLELDAEQTLQLLSWLDATIQVLEAQRVMLERFAREVDRGD